MDTREWSALSEGQDKGGSNGRRRTKPTVHPRALGVWGIGVMFVPAGLIAWVWSSDWRWALTGALVTVITMIAASCLNNVLTRRGAS